MKIAGIYDGFLIELQQRNNIENNRNRYNSPNVRRLRTFSTFFPVVWKTLQGVSNNDLINGHYMTNFATGDLSSPMKSAGDRSNISGGKHAIVKPIYIPELEVRKNGIIVIKSLSQLRDILASAKENNPEKTLNYQNVYRVLIVGSVIYRYPLRRIPP